MKGSSMCCAFGHKINRHQENSNRSTTDKPNPEKLIVRSRTTTAGVVVIWSFKASTELECMEPRKQLVGWMISH